MKKLSLFFFSTLILAACMNSSTDESLHYLALGDSYTIGESVDSSMRYPVQIADSLNLRGFPVENPRIIARTGWTTGELLEALQEQSIEGPYDLVTLLIGVNNQYRGMDTAIYREEFTALLDSAIGYSGGKPEQVLVLSIPDWGVMPFAAGRDREKIAKEIDLYNSMNKELSAAKGVEWIEITGISRLAETDSSLVAGDGLHPSGLMYTAWVAKALDPIVKILEK